MLEKRKTNSEKRALAILYSPKTLIDFTWYYHTYGRDYKWDVLIIACDLKIKIKTQCERSGMFENIFIEDVNYDKISRSGQALMFLDMFFCWMFGRKKKYVSRFFKKKGIILDYSLHLICSNYASLVSGLLLCYSDEIATVILEDGMTDYLDRTMKFDKTAPHTLDAFIAYIMCKMNYASLNTGDCARYITRNSLLCDKFSVRPELMKYKGYRSINQLGDNSHTDVAGYKACVDRMYEIEDREKYKADVILYSSVLNSFVKDDKIDFAAMTVEYIMNTFNPSRVLLKKHPRDEAEYVFPKGVEVSVIPADLPAELIADIVDAGGHVFMYTSTMLMSYRDYDKVKILVYRAIAEENEVYAGVIANYLEIMSLPKACIAEV
ncbi:MAG: hypothetical protein K6F34_05625 [Lachnospiraceae bacterium]|nr:hypothetical protein [Lachnospiraceae bacterium]